MPNCKGSPSDYRYYIFVYQMRISWNMNFFKCLLYIYMYNIYRVSLVAQMVKNLPAMQETWVWPLGQEDPFEKGMATHCSILAWRIPWTEESSRLLSMGSARVRYLWAINTHTHIHNIYIILNRWVQVDCFLEKKIKGQFKRSLIFNIK